MPAKKADSNKKRTSKTTPLFKQLEVLNETPKQKAFESQKTAVDELASVLKACIDDKQKCIIAYTAPHGTGKSVIINNAIEQLGNDGEKSLKKVDFDIWQYSGNDKDIWDGFVIRTGSSLACDRSEKKMIKKIDGGGIRPARLAVFSAGFVVICLLLWGAAKWLEGCVGSTFLTAFLKYAAPIAIVLFGLDHFLPITASPISRKIQYEAELLTRLKKSERPVIAVVEDIDRCADKPGSRIFLEELHTFIERNSNTIKQPFVVICPQALASLGSVADAESLKRLDANLKIYDEVLRAPIPPKLVDSQIDELLDSAGCTQKEAVAQILKAVLKVSVSGTILNFRSVKIAMRELNSFMIIYPGADIKLAAAFSVSRFVKIPAGLGNTMTLADFLKDTQLHYGNLDDNRKELLKILLDDLKALVESGRTMMIRLRAEALEEREANLIYDETSNTLNIAIDKKYSDFFQA